MKKYISDVSDTGYICVVYSYRPQRRLVKIANNFSYLFAKRKIYDLPFPYLSFVFCVNEYSIRHPMVCATKCPIMDADEFFIPILPNTSSNGHWCLENSEVDLSDHFGVIREFWDTEFVIAHNQTYPMERHLIGTSQFSRDWVHKYKMGFNLDALENLTLDEMLEAPMPVMLSQVSEIIQGLKWSEQ